MPPSQQPPRLELYAELNATIAYRSSFPTSGSKQLGFRTSCVLVLDHFLFLLSRDPVACVRRQRMKRLPSPVRSEPTVAHDWIARGFCSRRFLDGRDEHLRS